METNRFENDEKELEAEFEPFEDEVELKGAKYQVWLFHYDEDDNILDEENLLFTFADPDPAVAKAKELVQDQKTLARYATPKTAYFGIEVETVVDLDGFEENVATLFQEMVILRK